MMELTWFLGAAAALCGVIQYLPYLVDTMRGKTRPHAFSWFVWGLPAGIVLVAQWTGGAGSGTWATGVTVLTCTVIFVLSLFKGERSITRLDTVSFVAALVALALWAATHDPLWSVLLITVADTLGIVPTLRKSMTKPHEETASAYSLGALKWLLAIAALEAHSFTVLVYPVVMLLNNGLFYLFLMYRRRTVRVEND